MEEFVTYEYSVEPKKDARLKRKKTLLVLFYIAYCMIGITIAFFFDFGVLITPLIALTPVTCSIIVFFTWRYAKPEYVYSTESGVLTYTVIYGGKTKKKIFETRIADAEAIAPCSESLSETEAFCPECRYTALSTPDTPDAYYMLFTDKDGKRCVFYFEATAKSLKILRFYNPKTVVSKVRY